MKTLNEYSDRVRMMITDPINYWIVVAERVIQRIIPDKDLSCIELDSEAFKVFRTANPTANFDGYSWSDIPDTRRKLNIENSLTATYLFNDSSPMLMTRKFVLLTNGRSYCILSEALVTGQSPVIMGSNGGISLGSETRVTLWFPDTPEDRRNLMMMKLAI